MASGCLWESRELPLRKTGSREGTQGKAAGKASPSSVGGHESRGCRGAAAQPPALPLHPGAGELRPRAGGRKSFLPPGQFNAGSRTLPPMAGCLPVLLLQEQPTHLWACWAAGTRGGRCPRGGLSPGVGCHPVSIGWPGSATPLQTGSVRVSWGSAAPSQEPSTTYRY